MRRTLPIAALLVASLAQAADTPPPGKGGYPMDVNSDGFVTRDEAKDYPMLSAQFDAADANKDGKLDAYFFVSGVPTSAVTDLAASPGQQLVLIDHALRHRAQCGDVGAVAPRIPGAVPR